MTLGLIICAALFLSTLIGGKAWGQLHQGGIHVTPADLRQGIYQERQAERQARTNRCIPQRSYRWRYVYQIPVDKLKPVLYYQQKLTKTIRAMSSRCGSSPRAIIIRVFGPTAWAALRVAECESHLYPRAVGAAGERGLFQIHPVHFGWLDEWRLWEPLYNSRIAYRMSRGGVDWSAWACRP